MVRDGGDVKVHDFEPHWLLAEATSEVSLVPSIQFVEIPKASDRNGHRFADNQEALVETIKTWLIDRGL